MYPHRRFHQRDRQHLWDDSSDEEECNRLQVTTPIDTIDLSRSPELVSISSADTTALSTTLPVELTSFVLSAQEEQEIISGYIPRTLQYHSRRYLILPAFPTSFYIDRPPLLLANVPGMSLKELEYNLNISV